MQWRCYWYYNIHRCNPGTRKTKIIINKRHLYGAGKTARVGPSWWARGQPLEALIDQVNVNVPFSSIRPIYRGIPHAVWHMNYSFRIFQSCSVNTSFCTIYNKTRLQRVLESTCIHLYISVSIISVVFIPRYQLSLSYWCICDPRVLRVGDNLRAIILCTIYPQVLIIGVRPW